MRLTLLLTIVSAALLLAQSRPKFEVASIKPSSPGADGPRTRFDAGRITLQDYGLRNMIQAAYGLRANELIGGPPWIGSAHYDVTAKAAKAAKPQELWAMMQLLLEERFKLKTHREKKEVPAYNLTIATAGKLPGPKPGSCFGSDPTARPEQPAPGKPMIAPCGSILMPGVEGGAGLDGGQVRMPMLVSRLTDIMGRPVVDKTGFTGTFDLHIKFAFEGFGRLAPDASGPPTASDPSGLPSIFTAVREQLGLKLESAKAMIDVTVIDSIERPTGN